MLTWLDGRNGSSFGDLAWDGDKLTFSIAVGAGANGLQAMLPDDGPNGALQRSLATADAVTFTTQTIKGIEYAIFAAAAGGYAATYAADTTAPVISAVAATRTATERRRSPGRPTRPRHRRVDYGTTSGALTRP